MKEGVEVYGQGGEQGRKMRVGVQWVVYRCIRDVAGSQSRVVEIVGEFYKGLLSL
jgi:hypothetical protein